MRQVYTAKIWYGHNGEGNDVEIFSFVAAECLKRLAAVIHSLLQDGCTLHVFSLRSEDTRMLDSANPPHYMIKEQ